MSGNRIKYIDHKFKPGHLISGKAFTSKITGAKYRIILRVENKDDLQFFIRNERTKEHVFKSDIYTNMNVLKRKARSQLEEFGISLKKEIRDRTFGLCEKGTTQSQVEKQQFVFNIEEKDEL